MNKKELLRCVKERIGNKNIKFPDGIDFQKDNNIITLTMRNGAIRNMQEDSAAFEGWVLCMKAAMDEDEVVLDWEILNAQNLHYQRFLYRVNKFNEFFGGVDGWFKVKNAQRLEASRIKFNANEQYAINSPALGERINESDDSEENYLENEIVRKQDELDSLKIIFPGQLKRQLPVGVFEQEVSEKNAIFPHRKSAIDLWGIKKKKGDEKKGDVV